MPKSKNAKHKQTAAWALYSVSKKALLSSKEKEATDSNDKETKDKCTSAV